MVDWVTGQIGITDLEGGKEAAWGSAREQSMDTVVICLVPPGNPDAVFQYDLQHPPFSRSTMDDVADVIETLIRNGKKVVAHCGAGIERSPLVVAWWLTRYSDTDTIDDSYERIRRVRPQVQDRRHWVPEVYPEAKEVR